LPQQVIRESLHETTMPGRIDRTDGSQETVHGKDREKSEADERSCLDPARGEVGIPFRDDVVEAGHLVPELRAHTADEEIAVRRQGAEYDRRAILDCPSA